MADYSELMKQGNIPGGFKEVLDMEIAPSIKNPLKVESLLAEAVVSKHNQHTILMIVGKTGEGKSISALDIGYKSACYIAERLGGTWEDYFSADNIAVITRDEIIRVVKNNKPKQVVVLDDIGVGWSNREWQDKGNKILNRIIMTFRTKNNLLIMTVPDSFLLDKVPRNLLHYHFEMSQQHHDQGIGIYKPFRVKKDYRSGKVYYVYPTKDGVKYTTGVSNINNIPKTLLDNYNERRTRIQEEMENEDTAEFEEMLQTHDAFKEQSAELKDLKKFRTVDKSVNVYNMVVNESIPLGDALRMNQVSESTYYRHKKQNPSMFM